jgi:flagella basal body P-ring formation protein FlgA
MRIALRQAVLIVLAACVCGGAALTVQAGEAIEGRLKCAVAKAVSERCGFATDHLEITFHSMHLPETARDAATIVAEVPDYDDAIGAVTLKAYFSRNGETLAKISVPAHVSVFDDVLVTTKRLRRHDVLGPGDFKREWTDITNYVKWAVAEPDTAIGKRATRTINPGTIVDRRWLAEVPLVQRGDRITMACENNGVSVTGTAVALEDGYRDQEITVKAEWANRILRAVVVNAGTVTPVK